MTNHLSLIIVQLYKMSIISLVAVCSFWSGQVYSQPLPERSAVRPAPEITAKDPNYRQLLALYATQEKEYDLESEATQNRILKLVKARNDQKLLAQAYADLARVSSSKVKATLFYFKSLDIWDSLGSIPETIHCLNAIGEIFRATGDFKRSLTYLHRAVELCHLMNDQQQLAYSYNRIGSVYYEIALAGDQPAFSQSIYFTEQSVSQAEKFNDFYLIMSNMNILGANYLELKDYTQAHFYLEEALRLINEHNIVRDKPNILNNLASYYIETKNYEEAIKMASESYDIARELDIQTYLEVSTSILAKAYYSCGSYQTAYDFSQLSHGYYIKGFFNERNNRIFELQTRYESEKKELQLQAQRDREISLIILLISVLVVGFSIILTFFLRSRHYKKMNREINSQNDLISKQNQKLEDLIAERNRFFSIIAHDLRGPFTSIIGYADMLLAMFEHLSRDEIKTYVQTLKISAEQTYGLIINLLQWAHNQTGVLNFSPESLDLKEHIEANIRLLKIQADTKKIEFHADITESCFVLADKDMLQTILRNLISNAIKFSYPESTISITCKLTSASEDEPFPEKRMAEIKVRDQGVGISPENLKKLFIAGERIISQGTSNEAGTGLGLILCKEFIEKHGGTIRVESELGKGSCFIFTLPTNKGQSNN